MTRELIPYAWMPKAYVNALAVLREGHPGRDQPSKVRRNLRILERAGLVAIGRTVSGMTGSVRLTPEGRRIRDASFGRRDPTREERRFRVRYGGGPPLPRTYKTLAQAKTAATKLRKRGLQHVVIDEHYADEVEILPRFTRPLYRERTDPSRFGKPMFRPRQYATMNVTVEHRDGRVEYKSWRGGSAKSIKDAARAHYPGARLRFGAVMWRVR